MLKAFADYWRVITTSPFGIGAAFARQRLAAVLCLGLAVDLLIKRVGLGMTSSVKKTDHGYGGIINIGSIMSFQPLGVVAASKAYVLRFSEALWAEMRTHRVTLTTLSLRTKQTEFLDQSGVPGWAYGLVSPAAWLATRATVVNSSMASFHKHG